MMLRRSIVVGSLLMFSLPAVAQTAETPSLSQAVPMPREEAGVSGYRILAIATGAVVGVIVANALTGGMITPILLAGTGGAVPMMAATAPVAVEAAAAAPVAAAAAPAAVEVVAAAPAAVAAAPAAAATVAAPVVAGVSYAYMAAQTGVIIIGGVVGGYVGNWLYGK